MFVAKYLLFAVLALPVLELLVFILVASQIGFVWALALMLATSLIGATVLRYAGGSHIARARVVLGPQRISALQTDASGLLILLAGFLLLVPGFISDLIGFVLLIGPLRRWLGASVMRVAARHATQRPGMVDLAPEDWRQVPDAKLTDERKTHELPRPPQRGR
jgi:UPF0716 protein FxsA